MNDKGLLKDKPSENKDRNDIIITKCLFPECSGYYTDSISESIVIRCKSQRHNQESSVSDSEIHQVE